MQAEKERKGGEGRREGELGNRGGGEIRGGEKLGERDERGGAGRKRGAKRTGEDLRGEGAGRGGREDEKMRPGRETR